LKKYGYRPWKTGCRLIC